MITLANLQHLLAHALLQVRSIAVRQPAMDGTAGPPRVVLITDEPGALAKAEGFGMVAASERLILKARKMTPDRVSLGQAAAAAASSEPRDAAAEGTVAGAAGQAKLNNHPDGVGSDTGAEQQQMTSARLPETLTHWKVRATACL